MAENSKIEWTDHTLNFWIGCQEVSPACDNCYARTQNNHRKWVDGWGPDGQRRRTSMGNWQQLRRWNRTAGENGVRTKVFCNSLSDFFDNHKECKLWRREAWHYIQQSPNLDFLILTKRPQNIAKMLPDPETGVKPWGDGWANVWLGTTAENQMEADRRIPHLASVPAAVRFLSCEPLLGYLNLEPHFDAIDWVIAGGESGPRARPPMIHWVRSLREQCQAYHVPFFWKQWGEYTPDDPTANRTAMRKVGKQAAGAMLDGRLWREFPTEQDAPDA
jgi:protein gp37